jgi:hypothetical protein
MPHAGGPSAELSIRRKKAADQSATAEVLIISAALAKLGCSLKIQRQERAHEPTADL